VQYLVIGIIVLAAIGAVIYPLVRRDPVDRVLADDIKLEGRIQSYRAALRAGTVCARCLRDNPAGSHFCADCGKPLGVQGEGKQQQL
jgi:5-methylcytosine-specific restriction endonuclease McrA